MGEKTLHFGKGELRQLAVFIGALQSQGVTFTIEQSFDTIYVHIK